MNGLAEKARKNLKQYDEIIIISFFGYIVFIYTIENMRFFNM